MKQRVHSSALALRMKTKPKNLLPPAAFKVPKSKEPVMGGAWERETVMVTHSKISGDLVPNRGTEVTCAVGLRGGAGQREPVPQ